jgi:hypothetical protein
VRALHTVTLIHTYCVNPQERIRKAFSKISREFICFLTFSSFSLAFSLCGICECVFILFYGQSLGAKSRSADVSLWPPSHLAALEHQSRTSLDFVIYAANYGERTAWESTSIDNYCKIDDGFHSEIILKFMTRTTNIDCFRKALTTRHFPSILHTKTTP